MEPITRTLVHFSHALDSKDLSSEVVERAKYLLLDYLGVAIAGSLTDSSQPDSPDDRIVRPPSGPCTVIGTACENIAGIRGAGKRHGRSQRGARRYASGRFHPSGRRDVFDGHRAQ